jgi:hypothetical protein
MQDLVGLKVDVYFNLHKKVWSVKSRDRRYNYGRVIAHMSEVSVDNATFVVSQAGRERVLREKRKNVHAYVRGTLNRFRDLRMVGNGECSDLYYNPYKVDSFVDHETMEPVTSADKVALYPDRRVRAAGVV